MANWQNIIWREWRNTPDEEYAQQLFELVADQPINRFWPLKMLTWRRLLGGIVGGMSAPSKAVASFFNSFLDLNKGALVVLLIVLFPVYSCLILALLVTFSFYPLEVVVYGTGGLVSGIFVYLILGFVGGYQEPSQYYHDYKRRASFVWWKYPPLRQSLKDALHQACQTNPTAALVWADILQKLGQSQVTERDLANEEIDLTDLIASLNHQNWTERFLAYHTLILLRSDAAKTLSDSWVGHHWYIRSRACWVFELISWETTAILANPANNPFCRRCLSRWQSYERAFRYTDGMRYTFAGCPSCGESRRFFNGEVVAILDIIGPAQQYETEYKLYVNYIDRREPFDFDEVEIINATDQVVEQFAVQVGNDTDPNRLKRYRQMGCNIQPECSLNENTLRILNRFFGQVTHQERPNLNRLCEEFQVKEMTNEAKKTCYVSSRALAAGAFGLRHGDCANRGRARSGLESDSDDGPDQRVSRCSLPNRV